VARASDGKVSRADPARRVKAAREAAGKPAGAGVPLTVQRDSTELMEASNKLKMIVVCRDQFLQHSIKEC
jgi:hypothetical protein